MILSGEYLFCFLVTKSHCAPLDKEVKDSSQARNTLLRLNQTFAVQIMSAWGNYLASRNQ